MSLSDKETDEFRPLSVHSLDTFDDEVSTADEKTQPDYDRFKLLIEKPKFDEKEDLVFEALYKEPEELEEVIFKPLIEKKKAAQTTAVENRETNGKKDGSDPEEFDEPKEPVETPEQQGYREGFEKGLVQGQEKGHKEGFEKGFKEGETKGREQGEEKGFAAGEQRGLEQGMKEGEAKAVEEAEEKAREILSSLEDALKKADQTLENLVDMYEDRIIDMIKHITRKTVMVQLQMNEEIVKPLIMDALKHLVEPEEVILNVCDEDYEYIEMIKDEFFEQIDTLKNVSVRSDPSVKRGGCKIETHTASIATDPESRLEAIFEAMKHTGAA